MAATHIKGPLYINGILAFDQSGNFTGVDLTTTGNTILGNATSDTLAVNGNATFTGTATGNMADIVVTATTTGKGLDLSGNTALTTGILVHISSSATAITGAGRLLYSNHTGATGTSAILNEFASAATDETVVLKVTASAALALGVAFQVSAASMTTGTAIQASDLNALTTGIGLHLASSATAITGAGRLFYSNHTGATGTSATLNEFASAATDETVITKITASGALALGSALSISAAAATTAIVVNIADLDALTTGTGIKLYSNSADVSARFLLDVKNDNTAAVGALLARFVNDAPTSTNFFPLLRLNGFTLWAGNGNTPNAALSGTAGDWLIGGDAGKGYFCTGTTNWTAFA